MNRLKHIIDTEYLDIQPNKATRSDCLVMARNIKVAEPEAYESNITPEAVTFLQLWIHMTVNTKNGMNLYSGDVSKGEGVYPDTGVDHPIIDKATGKFYIDQNMGLLNFAIPGTPPKRGFLVGDIHRVTENFFLAAAHYQCHRMHNAFIDSGKAANYEDAKRLTCASLARIFADIMKRHLNLDYDADLVDRAISFRQKTQCPSNVMHTLEATFGFLRWAHTLVTGNMQGKDVFTRETSVIRSFSFSQMLDDANPSPIGMPVDAQVSESMTRMNHTGGEPDIRNLTMTRFCEQGLVSWGDMKKAYGMEVDDSEKKLPLWLGIISNSVKGRPDQITGDVLAAAVYDSCWGDELLDTELPDGMVTGKDIFAWLDRFPR